MSKIGKMPITIKEGVTITDANGVITVTGPKGTLTYRLPQGVEIKTEEGKVIVTQRPGADNTALWGLARALLANMVKGVSDGFEKKLELAGVGYRAQTSGTELTLSVGFSHQVKIKAPAGVTFKVAENVISVEGSDKSIVGDVADKIRKIRPPEPYKGKGISYQGEKIRRKAGKAAKAVGTK